MRIYVYVCAEHDGFDEAGLDRGRPISGRGSRTGLGLGLFIIFLCLSFPLERPLRSPLHATVADVGSPWQPVAALRGSRPWSNNSHSVVLIGKKDMLQRNIGCTLDATDVVHVEMCVVLHPQGRLPRGVVLDLSNPRNHGLNALTAVIGRREGPRQRYAGGEPWLMMDDSKSCLARAWWLAEGPEFGGRMKSG